RSGFCRRLRLPQTLRSDLRRERCRHNNVLRRRSRRSNYEAAALMPCGGIREGSARELCVREANLSHSRRLVHSMWRSCDRDPSELNGYRSMIGRDPEMVGIRNGWSLWRVCRGLSLFLISGLAGATLVRLAPGFGVDEQTLDPRLSARSVEALNRARRGESDPLRFYAHYVGALLRGDAGRSSVFGQPVLHLIRERAATSVRSVGSGLTI